MRRLSEEPEFSQSRVLILKELKILAEAGFVQVLLPEGVEWGTVVEVQCPVFKFVTMT